MDKRFWEKYILHICGTLGFVLTYLYIRVVIKVIMNKDMILNIPDFNYLIFLLVMTLLIGLSTLYSLLFYMAFDVARIKDKLGMK